MRVASAPETFECNPSLITSCLRSGAIDECADQDAEAAEIGKKIHIA